MADEEYPHAQDRVLTAARLAIGHQRALNRREVHQAEHLAEQIAALAPPSGTQYLDIKCGNPSSEALLPHISRIAQTLDEVKDRLAAHPHIIVPLSSIQHLKIQCRVFKCLCH